MIEHEDEYEYEDDANRVKWRRVALEDEILSVLASSPEPGERIEAAFRRKEHELVMLFVRLSLHDSFELRRRLTLALGDDQVAARFGRLISERRVRLMSFLEGARRREVLRLVR